MSQNNGVKGMILWLIFIINLHYLIRSNNNENNECIIYNGIVIVRLMDLYIILRKIYWKIR